MNQPQPPRAAPTVIGGRYEVGELLGRGGMAEVRQANDTRLGRTVAVKRLRTDLASDATFQARFHREAQSSASLNHPSIVAVYDTGEEPMADGVIQPYIVMELVEGRTLRDVLREGRKILPERALEITSDVLSALDYSHRAGIIHRDIKPGNVMLTPGGDVKVMDFGIARAMNDSVSTMTHTSAVVGTAQYLSPEQARGETVDSRSDVYSAGCLLYELLTGRPPFVGDSPVSVASQHVLEHPQPPSVHDPSLPPEIDGIVMKSLAKRVENRYQSASAMRSDIERFLAGRPVPAHQIYNDTRTATRVGAPVGGDPGRRRADDDERGPKPWLLVLLGLIVLGLVGAGAFLLPRLFDASPDEVEIPDVVGMAEADAKGDLADAGFVPEVEQAPSEDVPAGQVASQDPAGGTGVYGEAGDTITIVVSTGLPEVTMPNVVGSKIKGVRERLEGEDYNFTVKAQRVDSDQPKGTVLSSDPPAGEKRSKGKRTVVVLEVSRGPHKVPDVVGMTQQEAGEALRQEGFKPRYEADEASTEPAGTVVDQSPGAGDTLGQGKEVVVWVSYNTDGLEPCPTESVGTDPDNPDETITTPVEPEPGDPPTCIPPEDSGGDTTDDGDSGIEIPGLN